MENGERRTENGERRTENGEWRMENGEWRMETLISARFLGKNWDYGKDWSNIHTQKIDLGQDVR